MGGAVSAGEDNDELIDNLVVCDYIKTPEVERVFRAVDRGCYFVDQCRENAYRDLAWKHDTIHISAPCIYSEVMESLKLGPGMSFLNLGSGTGYLSTMAGLLLGPYGTNHGVELHASNVAYSKEILNEFLSSSPALDKYEFCVPRFVAGNCLLLDASSQQYDRVYCGASCPSEHENFIKNLVKVGGILVMPINDNLLQVMRTSETTFDVRNVLPVSFANLVVPQNTEDFVSVKLPENHPLFLQEICRSSIRVTLRKNIEMENPSLVVKRVIKKKHKRGKKHFRRIIIPLVERSPPVIDNREEVMGVPTDEEVPQPDVSIPNQGEDEVLHPQPPVLFPNQQEQIVHDMDHGNRKSEECDLEVDQEVEVMENADEITACKTGRRRTLTANGDSGIDNISDDSFQEECPSDDNEKMNESGSKEPVAEGCTSDRPRGSNYLKRSIDENGEDDVPDHNDEESARQRHSHCSDSAVIFKRVAFSDPDSDELEEIDSDSDNDRIPRYDEKNHLSRYTYFMRQKINQLPIPQSLKVYLNLSRPVS